MTVAVCRICESPLKAEIEKNDIVWNAERTVKWAKENGVRISKTMLARHRAEHVRTSDAIDEPTISAHDDSAPDMPEKKPNLPTAPKSVDDMEFLDAVRDRAFEKLLAGEFELKLDAAFKAIEIKYKISEQSGSEKLLLEILSEIRADELSRNSLKRSHTGEGR